METKKLAQRIAIIAKSKKALKVQILDMQGLGGFCDYFVIASGTSLRHVNAIAQAIDEELSKEKIKSRSRISQTDDSGWQVLDYTSVLAHIFYKPLRDFYALESLWSDAKKVRVPRSL